MSTRPWRRQTLSLAIGLALSPLSWAETAGDGELRGLDAIVVQGEIAYRDRSDSTAPVLVYDLEYFQRFEPLTVGDMLKRVPGVGFVSDILEFDAVQLRGLDPGYTQILINGKRVPGGGLDRSFFVDRIPAELVDRIEIVRSPSANRSGDAVAGALNIVLRDAYEFDGAYVRAGALNFRDGETKGTFGAVAGGEFGGGRLLGGVNVQGRYNPKQKLSLRFDEPGGELDNREDQSDIRDGTDYSANLSYTTDIGEDRFSFSALAVRTEREETERSLEYNDRNSTSRDHLLSENDQFEDIDTRNYAVEASYAFDALGGRNEIDAGWASFTDDIVNTEVETGYDDDDTPPSFDELEGERELEDLEDREWSLGFAHVRGVGDGVEMELGLDYNDKQRDFVLEVSEVATDEEGAPLPPFSDFDRFASEIEEQRIDPYLMFSGRGQAFSWEAGLRYEHTDVSVRADGQRVDNDYAELLPSAHLKFELDEQQRISASVARTVRRPSFDFLDPTLLDGEFGDNDFFGNPRLDPETAWGFDLGYEHRIGRRGVVGFNVFYRDVQDLIELVNTGAPSEESLDDYADDIEDFLDENPGAGPGSPGYPEFDPDSFVYTAANVGDGSVYGFEFDLSMPLDALGLEYTGVFANYAWLDSEVDDDLGERRFNNQARYVYNLGFIQDLPGWGASFGASYRKQGEAFARVLAEEVTTRYGGDLEVFIEKRFGDRATVRLTASNLLDASKDEVFDKFDTLGDQIDRDYDEFELETEESGPVFQLIGRISF
ncbi:MAG: TonB-dependent receptor [Lysobacterales bacterium]